MKFVNASKFYRKSGVRWGEPGAPVRVLPPLINDVFLVDSKVRRSKTAVSHISRKTSEIWGTLRFVAS
jgi:hypothetical protein